MKLIRLKSRRYWQRLGAKLIVLVIATSGLAIAVVASEMSISGYLTLRETAVRSLETEAGIVSTHSVAPLLFDDPEAGTETLASFSANPNVLHACILRPGGEVFATYDSAAFRPEHAINADQFGPNQAIVHGSTVVVSRDIFDDTQFLGTLLFRYDLAPLHAEARNDLIVAAFFGVVALLLSALLAIRLRRSLTEPVGEIIATTKRIAESGTLSHRARRFHNDELGDVTDAFNGLLDEVQHQQAELRKARDELEDRVEERTREVEAAMRKAHDAAASLKESQTRFELAVAGSNDGLWDFDPRLATMWYSPRCREMLGHDGGDTRRFPDTLAALQDRIDDEDEREFRRGLDRLLRLGRILDIEVRARHAGGEMRWIRIRGACVSNEDGLTTRAAGSMSDIHARKLAELEREQLARKLIDASREAGKSEVASGVLHNVGNALTSINTSTNLISERVTRSCSDGLVRLVELMKEHAHDLGRFIEEDEKGRHIPRFLEKLTEHLCDEQTAIREELQTLQSRVDHVKEVIASQQRFARMGSMSVNEEINVRRLVDEVLVMVSSARSMGGVDLEIVVEPDLEIIGDRNALVQILVNLATNAVDSIRDHSPDNPKIVISARHGSRSRVEIAVEDNGVGISSDALTRVFSHGFTTKEHGHGFGLHMSALTAKEMGGRLQASSEGVGHGAVFTLVLPRDSAAADEAQRTSRVLEADRDHDDDNKTHH